MDPAERRELVLSAARRALASCPHEKVSLVEVATETQASEALVHRYFASKAGLCAQVLRYTADELTERTRQASDALPPNSSACGQVCTSVLTHPDFIAGRSPGWVTYQALVGHSPGDEAIRVWWQAREAAVTTLAGVVGSGRSHRDDFTLWGYLGFLGDTYLCWVHAGYPDDQCHSPADAALDCPEGALGGW